MDIQITCQNCSRKFVLTQEDILFYKSQGWGPPKRCPSCRRSKYLGLKESVSKQGMKHSNLADNPQNHAGIAPVGFPLGKNLDSTPTQVVQLYCPDGIFYLRAIQTSRYKFSFVFLRSYTHASQFIKNSDFGYLLDLAMKFHPFTDSRILYFPPSESNFASVSNLERLQYADDWSSRYHARELYLHEFWRYSNSENDLSTWV